MTSNSLARTLFLLFGIYLIVQALVAMGSAFHSGPLLANPGISLMARIAAPIVFGVVPGLVFLYKAVDWADALMPASDAEPPARIEFTALLAVGCILLGTYFVIGGIAGLAGGVVALALQGESPVQSGWSLLASSVAQLAGGLVTILFGRRGV